ncbi:MAG: ABC transporter permease subunit [Methylobacteriaceae bacterium]|nr:ABC transporter permease subunit [Methylobacteriaceae bacterium]
MALAAGRAGIVLALLLALEAAVRWGAVSRNAVAPPSDMVAALLRLAGSGLLWRLAAPTFAAVAAAIALAVVGGLVFGLLLAASPRLRRAIEPLLLSYYAVPIFVFYPLLIVVLGLGPLPLVAIGAAFGVISVALSLLQGLDRLPTPILKSARLEGLGPWATAWHIRLPFAAPFVLHGAKLAVAAAFIGVIGGEFILAPNGLGRAIANAYNDFDNPLLYGLLLFVISVVTAVNLGLHAFERRLREQRGLA